tara:strand:- start:131 stop:709 length:579 start_codon:yes stop_codon:yes gene_type:complete
MGGKMKKFTTLFFLIIIISGLSFGVIFSGLGNSGGTVEKFNDIKFRLNPNQNIWIANINGESAAFSYLPQETSSVLVEGKPFDVLGGKFQIDVTSDINDSLSNEIALSRYQLGLVLNRYTIFIREGFTSENEFEIPTITCNDSTDNVPVLYFTEGNFSKIKTEGNCVIAEAVPGDMGRVKDLLVYGILGVVG